MRYSTEHKQETRERIVRTAAKHFRQRGSEGVVIGDLMNKLKLTHGGFYKHFASKEQLLTEAIRKAFDETDVRFDEILAKAKPGTELKSLIEYYLSPEHCTDSGEGCPMAALASEMARLPRSVRAEVDKAIKRRVKQVARYMPGSSEKDRQSKTMALLSGLVGTINIARALAEPEARRTLLEASKDVYIKAFCN
jgi:TetR/AcrR family transcriptional regulator, transcriptional repressor for nem operon